MSIHIKFSQRVPLDVQNRIKNFYKCANETFDPITKLAVGQVISSTSSGNPGELNFTASVHLGKRDASRIFHNTIARMGNVVGANLPIGSLQRTGKTLGQSTQDLALKYQKIMEMLKKCDPAVQNECHQLLDNATHLLVDALPKIKQLLQDYLYEKITPDAGDERSKIAAAIAKVLPYVSPQEFKAFSSWQRDKVKIYLDNLKLTFNVKFINMLEDLFHKRDFLNELKALDPYLSHDDDDLFGLYQLALVINNLEHFQRHPEKFAEIGEKNEVFYAYEEAAPQPIPHYVQPETVLKSSDLFGLMNRDTAFIPQELIVNIANDALAGKTELNSSLVQLLELGSHIDSEAGVDIYRKQIENALGVKLGQALADGGYEVIPSTGEKIDIQKIKQSLYDNDLLKQLQKNGQKEKLQLKSFSFAHAFGGNRLDLDYTPMPEGFADEMNQLFGNLCKQLRDMLKTKPLNEQVAHYTILKLAQENRLGVVKIEDQEAINVWKQFYDIGKTFDTTAKKHLPPPVTVGDQFGLMNRDTAFISQSLIVEIMNDVQKGSTTSDSTVVKLLKIGSQIDQEFAGGRILDVNGVTTFRGLFETQLGVKLGGMLPNGDIQVIPTDPSKPRDISPIKKSLYTDDFLRKFQEYGKNDPVGTYSPCFKHAFGGNSIRFDYVPAPAPAPAPAPKVVSAPAPAQVRAQAPSPNPEPTPSPSVVKQQPTEPKAAPTQVKMTKEERMSRPANMTPEEWNTLSDAAKASLRKTPYRKPQ